MKFPNLVIYQKKFLYSGEIEIDHSNAVELLALSDRFQIEEVKLLCECKIYPQITLDNVSEIIEIAHQLAASNLVMACIDLIIRRCDSFTNFEKLSNEVKRLVINAYENLEGRKFPHS